MILSEEGLRKVDRMRELSRKQYHRLSVLTDAVSVEAYNPARHQGEFLQLPYRPQLPIKDFNDPSTVLDMVFTEIGRGLAFSETRFIADHLAQFVTSDFSRTPLNGVLESYDSLIASRHEPSLILAPIDSYMDWYDDLMLAAGPNPPFRISTLEEKTYLSFPDGNQVRLAWSNKFTPFDDFFIVDKRWARWIVKLSEDDGEKLQISIVSKRDKLDVTFKLVFKLEALEASYIKRFTPLKGRHAPISEPQS